MGLQKKESISSSTEVALNVKLNGLFYLKNTEVITH